MYIKCDARACEVVVLSIQAYCFIADLVAVDPTGQFLPLSLATVQTVFAKVNLTIFLLISKVVNTTYPSSFNNFCYHDNHCTVLLPDHPPKITDGVGHGSCDTEKNKTRTIVH